LKKRPGKFEKKSDIESGRTESRPGSKSKYDKESSRKKENQNYANTFSHPRAIRYERPKENGKTTEFLLLNNNISIYRKTPQTVPGIYRTSLFLLGIYLPDYVNRGFFLKNFFF